jgi:hypothetical protein
MLSRNDELERFKTDINLAELAAAYGYKRDPKKSTRATLSLEDEAGNHLVVSVNPGNGHWRWFNPIDESQAGTVVDFLQTVEQISLGEVRKILREWMQTPAPAIRTIDKPKAQKKDRKEVAAFLERFDPVQQSSFAESRGISQGTLTALPFQGRILKGFKGALIFPHWDDKGLCGYEVKTFGFTSFSSKGYKSLWVSRVPSNLMQIVIAESGIEALSYYQIREPRHTLFASAGGNWSKDVADRLQTLMRRYPDAEIVGAFNHDSGGRRQSERLAALAAEAGNRYRDDLPPVEGADWNDMINDKFGAPKCGDGEKRNG